MDEWKWDKLVEFYVNLALSQRNTPYAEVAQRMLTLIQKLRQTENLKDVKIYTSVMTLLIKFSDSNREVYVDWDFDIKQHQVGIIHHEPKYHLEYEDVEEEEVLERVMNFRDRKPYIERSDEPSGWQKPGNANLSRSPASVHNHVRGGGSAPSSQNCARPPNDAAAG